MGQIEKFWCLSAKMVLFFTLAQTSGPQWQFSTNHTFFGTPCSKVAFRRLQDLGIYNNAIHGKTRLVGSSTSVSASLSIWPKKIGVMEFNVMKRCKKIIQNIYKHKLLTDSITILLALASVPGCCLRVTGDKILRCQRPGDCPRHSSSLQSESGWGCQEGLNLSVSEQNNSFLWTLPRQNDVNLPDGRRNRKSSSYCSYLLPYNCGLPGFHFP